MKRERLTPERIRRFTLPADAKQAFLWDTEAPRLAVRATAGAKSFTFESKLHRQTIRITIGDVRAWTLEDARNEARRLQTLIDQGQDPREVKRERIAAAEARKMAARRQDATVGDAWNAYLEARRPRWSERSYADHLEVARIGGEARKRGAGNIEPGPLATLLPIKLSALTQERVAAWLETENASRPTYAARAYRLLRAFIRWASGIPEYQAATHLEAVGSRVAKDHLHRVRAKEGDSLQREQLPAWFNAVRKLGNPVISAYLQALLLTGARREEMAGLRWEDVDFQWRSLTIRDKVEGLRTIPLTPFLAQVLRQLKVRNDTPPPPTRILRGKTINIDLENWKPSPWVFSSRTAEAGRLADPRAAHIEALAAAGLPHLTLHGLRRSFGTLAEWVECPVGIVAQIMGHKPSAIAEKHYRRRPLDLLRMWHTKIEGWVLDQAGIEQPMPEDVAKGLHLVKSNLSKPT